MALVVFIRCERLTTVSLSTERRRLRSCAVMLSLAKGAMKSTTSFYKPASHYGPLCPLPKMPNIVFGGTQSKPPQMVGYFNEEQFDRFVADHQMTEAQLKALDFSSYKTACTALGVSLDSLVAELLRLRVSGGKDVDKKEADAVLGFVHANFKFHNKISATATQIGGGSDMPRPAGTASKTENAVTVMKKDGTPLESVELAARLVSVSNSLKNNAADTSKRKGGVTDTLTYSVVTRPIGDMSRVVNLVLLAIADIANRQLYKLTPESIAPFNGARWPGLKYRCTMPTDKAEQTGYFYVSAKDGEIYDWVDARCWVLKVTPTKLSATMNNARNELLNAHTPAGATFEQMVQHQLDTAAADLGALNVVPRLAENAAETLARYCQQHPHLVTLPVIVAPIVDDASGATSYAYVPPEFMTKYHEFLAKGVVATVSVRLCDLTTKSQALALGQVTLRGAMSSGAGGLGQGALQLMDKPEEFLAQQESSPAYQLMLQLAAASASAPQLAIAAGGDGDDVTDAQLAAAAGQIEADITGNVQQQQEQEPDKSTPTVESREAADTAADQQQERPVTPLIGEPSASCDESPQVKRSPAKAKLAGKRKHEGDSKKKHVRSKPVVTSEDEE